MLSGYTENGITKNEEKIIKRSFDENFKDDITEKIDYYFTILSDKNVWYEIAIQDNRSVNLFNNSYSKLFSTLKKTDDSINILYKYNLLHQRYMRILLSQYAKMIQDFMKDLRWPMDFFMQKIAAERIYNDFRLRNINKMIEIVKKRIKDMDKFLV